MKTDLSELEKMEYSGRTVFLGMLPDGKPFMGYTLSGRSESSQARFLRPVNFPEEDIQIIKTEATDLKKISGGNPSLLLYPAMVGFKGMLLGSNGAQTKLLFKAAKNNPVDPSDILKRAHEKPVYMEGSKDGEQIDITTFEPDKPNYTPRISGALKGNKGSLYIVSLENESIVENIYNNTLTPGAGVFISTYDGGNESGRLLPFQGPPREFSIGTNSVEEITNELYSAISHGSKPGDNFAVSSAGMIMNTVGMIKRSVKNRHEKAIEEYQDKGLNLFFDSVFNSDMLR